MSAQMQRRSTDVAVYESEGGVEAVSRSEVIVDEVIKNVGADVERSTSVVVCHEGGAEVVRRFKELLTKLIVGVGADVEKVN